MTTEEKKHLYNFILNQIQDIGKTAESNYKNNVAARSKNPFLCFSEGIDKFMGLARSIDSQLGSRMQNIVFYLCKLRYGDKNVPNLILVNVDEGKSNINLRLYYTKGNLLANNFYAQKNPCQQKIFLNQEFSDEEIRTKIGVKKKKNQIIESQVYTFTKEKDFIKKISSQGKKSFPVDLFFIDTSKDNFIINTFEIKMSGYIDTKNAESNAKEVQQLYDTFNFSENNSSYFAVCYGECADTVKSKMKIFATSGKIMTANQFWNTILPNKGEYQLNYSDFIDTYKKAFSDSKIEQKITSL